MTLLRKVAIALAASCLMLVLGRALLLLQSLPGLLIPLMAVRGALTLAIAPALAARSWLDLHTGLLLPTPLAVALLLLAYEHLWQRYRRIRAALRRPLMPSRRAFLAGTGVAAVSACAAVEAYPEPGVTTMPLPLRDLPDSLVGLRAVLISDLHRGPVISREYLDAVVDRVNALRPDLVLLPGDFVSKSASYFTDVTAILARLRPTIASFATLGNHDNWEGTEEAKQAIIRSGVRLLHNSSLHLGPDRRLTSGGKSGLCLAGVDDLGTGKPDLTAALAGVSAGVPTLLLSHNPDFAEVELPDGLRVDLQISGHTHGGQVVLPGVGALACPSAYGLKYLYGHVQGPHWPVFITRGIGTSVLPVRVGAPPEIVLFETCRAGTGSMA